MSENYISWFHCGRCGSLFESTPGDLDDRLCTECGRSPSLGIEPVNLSPHSQAEEPADETGPAREKSGDRARHSLRKRKKNYFMLKLLVGWSLLLGLIIVGARKMFHEDNSSRGPTVVKSDPKILEAEEIAFLNEAGPACNQTFAGFLTAGTPEARNQFVLAPISTASRMARFYTLNPITEIDPSTLNLSKSALLKLPGQTALETIWNTEDGRQLDAVFMKEGGEWRLDWDHFVRYSEYPWALFLAGSGEPEGEFRLLARERLADERKNAETISIVLYAPRFGSSVETGFQSPEFLIQRESENGRLLDAAFKLERSGERVYGVKIPNVNPEGLIRVRVKVKRVEENMERHFVIEKIAACHWYSIDDPGVKPKEPGAGK